MSSDDLEGDDIWGDAPEQGESKQEESKQADGTSEAAASAAVAAPEPEPLEDEETRHMSISELRQRIHLINNDIRVMKSDVQRITHETRGQQDRIRENQEKVKLNKQLPYLVANVVEILEPDAEDGRGKDSFTSVNGRKKQAKSLYNALISPCLFAFTRLGSGRR